MLLSPLCSLLVIPTFAKLALPERYTPNGKSKTA
jgi:hypothetical protein